MALLIRPLVAALAAAAVLSEGPAAQQHSVKPIGPPGSWPFAIVFDPDDDRRVFIGLHGGGVFRTDDGGAHWSEANTGLTDMTIMPLVMAGRSPAKLYAGTHVGIFKSVDGARRWMEISNGLSNKDVWSLLVSPNDERVLYAGTAGGGVFKTTNAGATWAASSDGLTNPVVWPLAIDPCQPNTIYAGTFGGGLFKSTDGAAHWTAMNDGLTDRRVYAVTVDPSSCGHVIVGTSRGVYESTTAGRTWTSGGAALEDDLVFSLQAHASRDASAATLLAGTGTGVYRRAGTGWTAVDAGLDASVWPVVANPRRIEQLWAGTLGDGLYRYDGSRWTPLTTSLVNQVVFGVAVDPTSPDTFYAATAGAGVMKTTTRGRSWTRVNRGLHNRVIKAIALDPRASQTLFVAAQEQFLGARGGVFRSRDGGASWQQVGQNTLTRRVFSLAVDTRDSVVYVGAEGGGIFRSVDGGDTWTSADGGGLREADGTATAIQQAMHPDPVYVVAIDPSDSRVIYAATDNGIFRTRDGGAKWKTVSTGLADRRVRALVIDPARPATLYAGTGDMAELGRSGGVFKSDNGGETWTSAGLHGQWVLALAINPQQTSTICAGTDQGVSCSDTRGSQWTPVATGGIMRYVLALALHPSRPNTLLAATEGNSILEITRSAHTPSR